MFLTQQTHPTFQKSAKLYNIKNAENGNENGNRNITVNSKTRRMKRIGQNKIKLFEKLFEGEILIEKELNGRKYRREI